MTNPEEARPASGPEEGAAFWLAARLDDGSFDQPGFERWLAADPRNAAALAAMERTWHAAALLDPRQLAPRRGRRAALAAAAGGGVAALAWALLPAHPFADLSTGIGERRRARLADGSEVELSAATALSIDITAEERLVRLEAGEAFFQAAPDPSRPFRVAAAGGVVTALGTAFAVAQEAEGARVVVTEHRVAVRSGGRQVEVAAGQACAFAADRAGVATPVDPAVALAWRQDRLVFLDAPLGEVIEAIGRWRRGRVLLMDDALRSRRVTAIIDLRRPSLLEPLAASLPIRLQHLGPLTLIHPRS